MSQNSKSVPCFLGEYRRNYNAWFAWDGSALENSPTVLTRKVAKEWKLGFSASFPRIVGRSLKTEEECSSRILLQKLTPRSFEQNPGVAMLPPSEHLNISLLEHEKQTLLRCCMACEKLVNISASKFDMGTCSLFKLLALVKLWSRWQPS